MPVSTPAGTSTWQVRLARLRPEPPQAVHLSAITLPEPPHILQVRSIIMKPPFILIRPVPLQVEQVLGWVPGLAPEPLQTSHTSLRVNSKVLSQPKAASSKVSLSSYWMSLPCTGALRRWAPPMAPPNSWLKISSPMPPKPLKSNPPAYEQPPPLMGSSCPKRSYLARLSGSESTSLASFSSMNRASASLSSGC